MSYDTQFHLGLPLAAYFGLASWLFCGPLSEPDEILSGLKWKFTLLLCGRIPPDTSALSGILSFERPKHPMNGWRLWVFKPLMGCGKCQTAWLSAAWQLACYFHGFGFDFLFIILAVSTAAILEKWLR